MEHCAREERDESEGRSRLSARKETKKQMMDSLPVYYGLSQLTGNMQTPNAPQYLEFI